MSAYAKATLAAVPPSPSGVFRDYYLNLPIIDPERLRVPPPVIAGKQEAVRTMGDLTALFQALAAVEKQLAVIPGGGARSAPRERPAPLASDRSLVPQVCAATLSYVP